MINRWVCTYCEMGACYVESYAHTAPNDCPWSGIAKWYRKKVKVKLKKESNIHKHYGDRIFELVNVDGEMVNVKYFVYGRWAGICLHQNEIEEVN